MANITAGTVFYSALQECKRINGKPQTIELADQQVDEIILGTRVRRGFAEPHRG